MTRARRVVVNGAFRPQRITGQQRYAVEIADRLVARGAREVRPGRFWGASAIRTWLWSLVVLPLRTRRDVLVSLTARAPAWHPRHVVAVHDLFVLTDPEWYSTAYVRTHAPLLRAQLRTAAAVFAVSAPVARQVEALVPGRVVALAPNAPSEVFVPHADAADVLGRTGLDAGRFLLAIGSHDPRKNLARLAAAWVAIPEPERLACPLAVVGGGAAIFAKGDVQWPSGTVVTGYVTDPELSGLYAAARGVVFVSLAEGFGLPIVEAAASGVDRFVLSDIEVFRWIAGDGATYVDPRSEASVTAGLRSLLGGAHPAENPVEAGRFNWDTSADEVAELAAAVAAR